MWNAQIVLLHGTKPRVGRLISQQLACMCTCIHCMNSIEGTGCFKYELLCKLAQDKGQLHRPYVDDNCNFICPVSICQYSAVYYRQERKCLSEQIQTKLQEKNQQKPQTKIDVLSVFMKRSVDLIQDQYTNNENGGIESAISLGGRRFNSER